MAMKRSRGNVGFTPIEIVIVVSIISVLVSILAPTLAGFFGDSKIRKAETDVRNIGAAIGTFLSDTGQWPVWQDGTKMVVGEGELILLVSAGDIPDADDPEWKREIGRNDDVDTIANQLIKNTPNNSASRAYPTTGRWVWRGPYLETDDADPWGNRYMVNVLNCQSLYIGRIGGTKPAFVISAGPNKRIETAFEQTGPDVTVGGDDIVFRFK